MLIAITMGTQISDLYTLELVQEAINIEYRFYSKVRRI